MYPGTPRTLPGSRLEYRVADEVRIDVLDVRARRVVEAKLEPSVVSVAHAYGQAAADRMLLNDAYDARLLAETVAVLLPTAPTAAAHRFLESQSLPRADRVLYLTATRFAESRSMMASRGEGRCYHRQGGSVQPSPRQA